MAVATVRMECLGPKTYHYQWNVPGPTWGQPKVFGSTEKRYRRRRLTLRFDTQAAAHEFLIMKQAQVVEIFKKAGPPRPPKKKARKKTK